MATPNQEVICAEINALSSHYLTTTKSPDDHARWLIDFATDLGDLTPEQVRRACAAWRTSDAKKFPTPGQLRKTAPLLHVEALPAPRAEPWRPISNGEYQALTIIQKIRHHRSSIGHALDRAGPMWRDGKPVGPEELPASWHEWRQRARNHADEAGRLQTILDQPKGLLDEAI